MDDRYIGPEDDRLGQPGHGMLLRIGFAVFGPLTVVVFLLGVFGERGLLEAQRKGAQYEEFERRVAELEAENAALVDEIQALRSSPTEIERHAREELKLVRPGEIILVIPPDLQE